MTQSHKCPKFFSCESLACESCPERNWTVNDVRYGFVLQGEDGGRYSSPTRRRNSAGQDFRKEVIARLAKRGGKVK